MVTPISFIAAPDPILNLEEVNHTDIDIEIRPTVSLTRADELYWPSDSWRNSLACVSTARQQLYLALSDQIHIYDLSEDGATYSSCLYNTDKNSRRYPTRDFHSAIINRLAIGKLGTSEVLVSVDGNGRAYLRYTSHLTADPILLYVPNSAWGIAFSPRHRLLAISNNDHQVDIFDLTKSISENATHAIIQLNHNIPFVYIHDAEEPLILAASIEALISLNIYKQGQISNLWNIDWQDDDMYWSGIIIPPSEIKVLPIDTFIGKCQTSEYTYSGDVILVVLATQYKVFLYCNGNMITQDTIPDTAGHPTRYDMMHILPGMQRIIVASPTGHHAIFEILSTRMSSKRIFGLYQTRERVAEVRAGIIGMDVTRTRYGCDVHCVSDKLGYTRANIFRRPVMLEEKLLYRSLGRYDGLYND